MAGYQLAYPAHFATPSAWLTSGADANFPATNLALYSKPWRVAKSSGNVAINTTYFGASFAAPVALVAIAIDNINITSVTIEAASNNTFSADVLTAGPITIGQNGVEALPQYPLAGKYKHLFFTADTDIGSNTRAHWRVVAQNNARVPGWDGYSDAGSAGKLVIGSLVFITAVTTLASGTSSYDETPLEATLTNENFAGGGSDPVVVGNPYGAIGLGGAPASRSAMRADLLKTLRHGVGRWFLFSKNSGDSAEFYIVRRAVDVSLRQNSPNTINFDGLTLQTAV